MEGIWLLNRLLEASLRSHRFTRQPVDQRVLNTPPTEECIMFAQSIVIISLLEPLSRLVDSEISGTIAW